MRREGKSRPERLSGTHSTGTGPIVPFMALPASHRQAERTPQVNGAVPAVTQVPELLPPSPTT